MPYIVKGKILDAEGYAFDGTALLEEIGSSGVVMNSVMSNAKGEFTFPVDSANSLVRVVAFGHVTTSYKAAQVPAVITLEPNLIISGTVKKLKDNSLWIALGVFALAVTYSLTNGKKKAVPTPRLPKQPPLVVTV